jgi:hypothetical protein
VQYDNLPLTDQQRCGTLSNRAIWITIGTLASVVAVFVVSAFYQAQKSAHASAKSALLREMEIQLKSWPEGKDYPTSLSELPLTYPDGGDASLLREFDYSSTGQTCSIRTFIWDRDVVVQFPKTERDD